MDEPLPLGVVELVRRIQESGCWVRVSSNREPNNPSKVAEAHSCRDAARKRLRFGFVGIPLQDELKSFLGSFRGEGGDLMLVAAHCRADRLIDFGALGKAIGATSEVLRVEEVDIESLGLAYGLVHPFIYRELDAKLSTSPSEERRFKGLVQVFDEDLVERSDVPGTSMTNAGHREYGIEIFPHQVQAAVPNSSVANITDAALDGARLRVRSLGILTGNPPEAGTLFCQLVSERLRSRFLDGSLFKGRPGFEKEENERLFSHGCQGDFSMPVIRMVSIPELGLSMELNIREDQVWSSVNREVRNLIEAGCEVISIPCNTLAFFGPRLKAMVKELGAEYVSMPEACRAYLDKEGVSSLAFVGIPLATSFEQGFSGYKDAFHGLDVETLPERQLPEIIATAYKVKGVGADDGRNVNKLREYINGVKSGTVLIALTELSLIGVRQKFGNTRTILDSLGIYAKYTADALVRWVERIDPAEQESKE